MKMFIIGGLIGLWVGATIGFLLAGIMVAASNTDDEWERWQQREEEMKKQREDAE